MDDTSPRAYKPCRKSASPAPPDASFSFRFFASSISANPLGCFGRFLFLDAAVVAEESDGAGEPAKGVESFDEGAGDGRADVGRGERRTDEARDELTDALVDAACSEGFRDAPREEIGGLLGTASVRAENVEALLGGSVLSTDACLNSTAVFDMELAPVAAAIPCLAASSIGCATSVARFASTRRLFLTRSNCDRLVDALDSSSDLASAGLRLVHPHPSQLAHRLPLSTQ